MQGVEILTSAQVATELAFNWDAYWITFIIIFIVCLVAGILSVLCDECELVVIPVLSIVGIIFGLILGAGIGKLAETPSTYETQYKITVSDEVSMTEFYEHYEVVEQDGKIFTVREKTNESN